MGLRGENNMKSCIDGKGSSIIRMMSLLYFLGGAHNYGKWF